MHEIGHGLYERGVSPALERTPLASGCSSGLHESQSRLWENVVGRSLPFCRWLHPQLVGGVPGRARRHDAGAVLRAPSTTSQPSFIRVDADEVTYGMHIILRFELEQELIAGTLSTADLPEAWNARFEEYLGLAVPEDRLGVLQDVHWSCGLFGYFPTYQLGNVMSVQIWEAAQAALPDLEERVRAGRLLGARDLAAREPLRARAQADAEGDARARRRRAARPGALPPLPARQVRRRRRRLSCRGAELSRQAAAVPKRFAARALRRAASTSRSRGGAAVTRSSSRWREMWAISRTARSKTASFAFEASSCR